MPKIENCPCCGGEMRHEGTWECENVMCPYQVRPDARSIAAHNALSLKVQRAEQLEHFEELAVPIVKWTQEYHKDQLVRTGYDPNKQKLDECTVCLAASPATEPLPTFEDVRGIFKRPEDILN